MRPTLVLDVVGLTRAQLGPDAPRLTALAAEGFAAPIGPLLPAVTCPVQTTYLTGALPREHGIVANGWYDRDTSEVLFWKQSNRLVQRESVWTTAKKRDPQFTSAQLFWWFNMYCGADVAVTPRPAYPADGRKIPDCYASPPSVRLDLNAKLGKFPLFRFWGPFADLVSTRWIADAALHVLAEHRPTLALVYLPHLDYDLQRFGPGTPEARRALREVDAEVGRLADAARAEGREVLVVSEYGIEAAAKDVALNRALRQAGFVTVQNVLDRFELLDCGASRAFAVADHQLAHVYVRDAQDVPRVKALLEKQDGVERVLDEAGKRELGLDHARSGELVALAAPGRWFSYYYWLDDARKPDFAPTVDIFRKPGYDPAELFLAPGLLTRPRLWLRVAQKLLGFRALLDVIPTDGALVRGTHGRAPASPDHGAVLIASSRRLARDRVDATAVRDLILETVFGSGG